MNKLTKINLNVIFRPKDPDFDWSDEGRDYYE